MVTQRGKAGWPPALGEWSLISQRRVANGGGKMAAKGVAGCHGKMICCIEQERPSFQMEMGNKDVIDAASLGP
jgi:hypothetical protein